MELSESCKIARAVLDKEGYPDYDITSYYATKGTNVTTVIATKKDLTVMVTIAEGVKQTILNRETVDHSIFIQESLSTSTASLNHVSLIFDLEQPLTIGGVITNRSNEELIMDGGVCKGIKMTVPDTKDETIDLATEKANRIANYLSHQTNFSTKLKKPKITVIKNNKAIHTINYTVDTVLAKPCDIDLQNISPIIDSNSPLNQRLARYEEGLKSLTENDSGKAIQNFYQSIEGSGIPEDAQYRILRHAVSHIKLDDKGVIDLKKFGIIMNPGDYLNLNDPNVQFVLQTEARKLQSIALKYIDTEMKNASMKSRW